MIKSEYLEAKDYFERLIEISSEDPIAWYNLAGVYEKLDDPQVSDFNTLDMAMQAYMKVLEFDPNHLESSFKLMENALNLKKPDMAVKVMEDAVDSNPDEPLPITTSSIRMKSVRCLSRRKRREID